MVEHLQPEHPAPRHSGYERSDLTMRVVLYFMGGLVLGIIVVVFFLEGVYGYLNKRERGLQPPMSPLVSSEPHDTRVMPGDPREYLKKAFPEPRLEHDERGQLHDIVAPQDERLGSYGYVDEKAGVVRIPIERAMDLVAQRGLPTRPPGSAQAPAAEKSETPVKAKGKKK